jgi:hypothetical protein
MVQDERLITKTYFPRLHLSLSAALSVAPDLAISTALLLPGLDWSVEAGE